MERRLAAIMAADVVAYSRLMERDEAGTLAALKAHREELIDPSIADHQGRIVKLMGDGALVEFASVVDAVACAAAIQTGMAERHGAIAPDRRIVFRIGVNLGDVIVEDDDIYGNGVNVAARLEALADPGGVCLSGAVHDEVKHKLDLAFDDMGERSLKNIDEPVRVYRILSSQPPLVPKADTALTLPDKPSIAVLPFTNMSGDPDQEYFADGIAEDIITGLSRMRWFFVSARNSSFTYKGRAVDIRQVSRELGVRYVLQGSVRRAGNRARITIQLIDATNGNHLWAERYDRDLSDLFAVQDEITETVVATIEPQLYVAESDRAGRKTPGGLDAWDRAMRAMRHIWKMTEPDNLRAQELLQAAIARDPGYAPAYGPLGFSLIWHAWMGWGENPIRLIPEAETIGRQAVALDDQDPWAHLAMAGVYGYKRRHADATLHLAVVYDRDYRCEEEVDEILRDLRAHLEFAHIHRRKEIENYLLVPSSLQRALTRAARERERRTGVEIVLEESAAMKILAEITDAIKWDVQSQYVDKRVEYFDKGKVNKPKIIGQAIQIFEGFWSNLEGRMEVVPGKQVLGALRARIAEKYALTLTDERIVSAMTEDEVPADLRDLLKGLDEFRKAK